MTIGEAIRKARKERKYSRQRLADEAKISVMTIVRWELGISTPNLLPLLDVANVLKISLDELVGRKVGEEE
jgi:transcriptional regulator with XRE-family HTH domain